MYIYKHIHTSIRERETVTGLPHGVVAEVLVADITGVSDSSCTPRDFAEKKKYITQITLNEKGRRAIMSSSRRALMSSSNHSSSLVKWHSIQNKGTPRDLAEGNVYV